MYNIIIFLKDNSDLFESVTSIASVIISLAAISISIISGKQQQMFTRINYRPLTYIDVVGQSQEVTGYFGNAGNGSLELKKLYYVYHDMQYEVFQDILEVIPTKTREEWNYTGDYIQGNTQKPIFRMTFNDEESIKNTWLVIGEISIYVEYTDIFGEEFKKSWNLHNEMQLFQKVKSHT